MALMMEATELQKRVTLEIESFYQFANIFLDQLATCIELIFGQSRGRPLKTHDELVKGLAKYAKERGMDPPSDGLMSIADKLQKDVSDFRDKVLTHLENHRRTFGIGFDKDFNVSIHAAGLLYPKDSEMKTGDDPDAITKELAKWTSRNLKSLTDDLDAYVESLAVYLTATLPKAKGFEATQSRLTVDSPTGMDHQ